MKFTPYSYSKINTYTSCPRKFKYNYIDKLGKFETSPALIKGSTIHYLIENLSVHSDLFSDEMKTNIKDFPETLLIIENFKKSDLGKKYLTLNNKPMNEIKLGLDFNLNPSEYSRDAMFYGIVDYICFIDIHKTEIVEVNSLDDLPDGYKLIEILED